MPKYTIDHTDVNKLPKEVDEGSVDDYSLDIALFGRIRLEYGERLNQNLLNLLENFSALADPSVIPSTPTPMPSVSITPSGFATSPTPTPTVTRSPTRTATPSASAATPTPTSSVTPTPAASGTTPTPTRSPTPTPSVGASMTPTPSPTRTVTPTVTITPTVTPTPSAVSTITLGDIPTSISGFNGSTPAWASLTFNGDGTFGVTEHFGPNNGLGGVWAPSGIGSDYELFYTYTDGSSPPGSDPGPGESIWHGLGTSQSFGASDSVSSEYQAYGISITIRKVSDHADTQSINIYLDADGACFAYGTQLLTPSGLAAIQDLNVGDTVSSYNIPTMIDESEENWRDWTTTDISGLTMTTSTVRAKRVFSKSEGISINGLVTTKDHIYFVCNSGNYGWKNACNVTIDDKLVNKDGVLLDITEILPISGALFVALDVETTDTLIAHNGDQYILAHNLSA